MLLAFLDTETTGLDPDRHRALEIALRVIDSQTMHHIVSYETLIRQSPEVWAEADPRSLKIHGLTKEKLLDGKEERVVESELLSILKGCGLEEGKGVFLCQNPSFDRPFFSQLISQTLQEECKQHSVTLCLSHNFLQKSIVRIIIGRYWKCYGPVPALRAPHESLPLPRLTARRGCSRLGCGALQFPLV